MGLTPLWTVLGVIGGKKRSKCTFLCTRENPDLILRITQYLTFFSLTFSSFSDFSDLLAFLSRSFAANFKLNKCSDSGVKDNMVSEHS